MVIKQENKDILSGIEVKRNCFAWMEKDSECCAIESAVFRSYGCKNCPFYQDMKEYVNKQMKIYGYVTEHYRKKAIDAGLI